MSKRDLQICLAPPRCGLPIQHNTFAVHTCEHTGQRRETLDNLSKIGIPFESARQCLTPRSATAVHLLRHRQPSTPTPECGLWHFSACCSARLLPSLPQVGETVAIFCRTSAFDRIPFPSDFDVWRTGAPAFAPLLPGAESALATAPAVARSFGAAVVGPSGVCRIPADGGAVLLPSGVCGIPANKRKLIS